MKSTQLKWILAVSFAALTGSTAAVQAEVWRDVVRGMTLLDYQFDANRNYLGNGWDLNAAALYNGQEYDFGFAELTLGSANAPTISNISMGYTLRGIPKAEFSWNTGGQALPYQLQFNNGFQDFTTVNGSILVDVSTDINVLGFYDTRIQISNRGSFDTDGFITETDGSLAFDVGPIDVSGNIYADALAVITQPFWIATNTENPFSKFSERATKTASLNTTIDELRARIEAGEILSDEEMATLVNSTLLAAMLEGDASNGRLFQDLALPISKDSNTTTRVMMDLPEPTTALLMFALSTLMVSRRSRR
jgi:hypothetical protein